MHRRDDDDRKTTGRHLWPAFPRPALHSGLQFVLPRGVCSGGKESARVEGMRIQLPIVFVSSKVSNGKSFDRFIFYRDPFGS